MGDVTGVTYAATNLTLIDETFTPMSADAMGTPATFSATFQALDAVGADVLATLQVTALSDQGMASAPNGVNLTVIARKDDNTLPNISKPTVEFMSLPIFVHPEETITLTVEAYSTNANIEVIEWKTDNSDLSLLNADDIPTGSTDSKDKPLTLSAEFQASDFVSLEQANITVIVRDGSAGIPGIPTSKNATIDLKPWSKPTLVKVTATPEVSSGQTIAFELDAFDEDSYISHVNWFTDSPNGEVTLPSYDVPSGHQNDSADNLLEIDTFFETKDGLLNDLDVNVWAEVTSFNGTQSITEKQPVKIKKAVRPTIGVMTHAYRGDHQHLNPTQPIQDNDQITISATASAETATAGPDEIKITSYRWSQMPGDEVELTLDEYEQSIPAQDQKNTVETPINITLPKTGKDGSESETIYNLKLIVTDERGLESEAKEFELRVKPHTQLNVMTANTFLITSTTVGGNGKDARVDEYIKLKDELFGFADVIALTEAFTENHVDKLVNGLGFADPSLHTSILGTGNDWDLTENDNGWQVKSGGVVVLSRYPITYKAQHIFSEKCAEDGMAMKGFVHVKLKKDWKTYNIIATHTQADPSVFNCSDANATRLAQLQEIRNYIDRHISDTEEYVYVVGDINIDKGDPLGYPAMLDMLNAPEPKYAGMKYSWDYEKNSLAFTYNYGSNYVKNNPPLLLDHLLYDEGFAKPRYWNNVILDPIAKDRVEITVNVIGNKDRYHYPDLSDHFPAIAFEYLDGHIPEQSYRGQNKRYNTMRFKVKGTNRYIHTGSDSTDWVDVKTPTGTGGENWFVDSYAPTITLLDKPGVYPTCILSNTYVEVQSKDGGWLNWGHAPNDHYYWPNPSNASKYLNVEHIDQNRNPIQGCIENGAYVLFKDGSYASNFEYNQEYNGFYASSGETDKNQGTIFEVEMDEPEKLDWSDLPKIYE
ncbi:sphingomyelin phosphodiesterase [Vibrio lentus]|uniref:sphingomyelin phosphodiesterase n=1 Tax=Vibrio lentus TaxID=136468 RepID=UPI0039A6479A